MREIARNELARKLRVMNLRENLRVIKNNAQTRNLREIARNEPARNCAKWNCTQITRNEQSKFKLCGKKQGATQLAHNITKVQIKLYAKKERKVKYELIKQVVSRKSTQPDMAKCHFIYMDICRYIYIYINIWIVQNTGVSKTSIYQEVMMTRWIFNTYYIEKLANTKNVIT